MLGCGLEARACGGLGEMYQAGSNDGRAARVISTYSTLGSERAEDVALEASCKSRTGENVSGDAPERKAQIPFSLHKSK